MFIYFRNVKPNKHVNEPKVKIDPNYNPFKNEIDFKSKQEKSFDKIQSVDTDIFNKGYIFKQISSKLFLKINNQDIHIVHKIRAHKRVLYEFYLNAFKNVKNECQKLAFPISFNLSNKDYEILNEIKNELFILGFLFELKDNNKVTFLGLPINFKQEKLQNTIEEFIEEYTTFDSIENNVRKNLALSMSQLLKVNDQHSLSESEMSNLNNELMKCEYPNFSPKGKPTIMKIDINEIQKFFR